MTEPGPSERRLPPSALSARQMAARAQARGNARGAMLLGGFVVGVFCYCISAVEQDPITERDLEQFRRERELERARNAASSKR
eukprot:CAMPEP_0174727134 /NCGR_PEP_ID=MMETSP1094-20130205/49163_1 /TAXON_ID=156173 /ORGANISM="Chrysochromulina brevifilum, Strain UTEX LB 985" /LENGTH=82 /DNA_ID=CAMNT_0015928817 /DNA_START=16 /DNA_END=264 /DNA_ORIENTATION=-